MDSLRTEQKNEVDYLPLPPSEPSPTHSAEDTDLEDQEEVIPLEQQVERCQEIIQNNTEYIEWLHKRIKSFEDQVAKLNVLTQEQNQTIQKLTQANIELAQKLEQKK
jgi:predicted RNase H-like nuclease (RuvC/YqgF family)